MSNCTSEWCLRGADVVAGEETTKLAFKLQIVRYSNNKCLSYSLLLFSGPLFPSPIFISLPRQIVRVAHAFVPISASHNFFPVLFLIRLLPVYFAIVMEFEAFIRTENKLA